MGGRGEVFEREGAFGGWFWTDGVSGRVYAPRVTAAGIAARFLIGIFTPSITHGATVPKEDEISEFTCLRATPHNDA